jgi:hypothetical protein
MFPEDTGAAVHLWLDGYRNSRFGRAVCPRLRDPSEDGTSRGAFFELEGDRVTWHLARGDVTFLVDDVDDEVIYGMAVTTGDYVHYAMVKRYLTNDEKADGLLMLLGDRLARAVPYTSDLLDLRRVLGTLPDGWYLDGGWYFREMRREMEHARSSAA